jgi:hypothetical protein
MFEPTDRCRRCGALSKPFLAALRYDSRRALNRSAWPRLAGNQCSTTRTGRAFLPLAALLWSLAPAGALAQSSSIDWSKIAGGGGVSTNGQYALSGTIGQPDAGTMSGGNFSLQGGFWSVLAAVQTPGAPRLAVARTATNTVAVFWPNADPGWKLQWTAALAPPASWTELPPPYATNGSNCVFVGPPPVANRFYRLHKP